jgi:FtsH-binding integral membrane protein
MAAGQLKRFLTADWCFAGVILFFIVHGYSENQGLVPLKPLLLLLAGLLAAGLALFFLFRKIFRSGHKTTVYLAFVLTLVLFFGAFQDFLANIRFLSSLTRLTILLPVCLVLMIVVFAWFKKTKLAFSRTVLFLNLLLSIYIIVDLSVIASRSASPAKGQRLALGEYTLGVCDTCETPSVYLVLLDSYYGSEGLKAYFNYDNTAFENFLTGQGFHINRASHSNYYYTLFSMASLLNMTYLHDIGAPVIKNHYGYTRATGDLRNNTVCRYFQRLGYHINNFSGFDMPGVPAGYNSGLLPDKIQLITHKTMYYRVKKYFPMFLARMGWMKKLSADIENEYISTNEAMMRRTLEESRLKNTQPVFTYLHLMMPHGPFVFDSLGNRTNIMQRLPSLSRDTLDKMFLQYQVYTNKKMTEFITRLQKETAGKAVILLLSDHGYQPAYEKEKKLAFYNLNAVYLPNRQYNEWYPGISNVNQFRALLNTLFHEQLPLADDSVITQ